MNYVKHLSIALLVLGTASVYAAAPVKRVVGWTTPKGTALELKADKSGWTLKGIGVVGDAREKFVVGGTVDKPTLSDDNKAAIVLKEVLEKDGIVDTIKTYYKDYLGENGTVKSRAAVIVPTAVVLGAIAYKTVPAFKDAADKAGGATRDFAYDLKDNNGNARRNAGIAVAVAAVGGVLGYRYQYGNFPGMKAA